VFGLIDRWKLRGGADVWEADIERLQAVRAERAAAAQSYFAAHAGDWDRLRSLHIARPKSNRGRPAPWRTGRRAGWSTSAPAPGA
jgi:hypothetical protein